MASAAKTAQRKRDGLNMATFSDFDTKLNLGRSPQSSVLRPRRASKTRPAVGRAQRARRFSRRLPLALSGTLCPTYSVCQNGNGRTGTAGLETAVAAVGMQSLSAAGAVPVLCLVLHDAGTLAAVPEKRIRPSPQEAGTGESSNHLTSRVGHDQNNG